MNSCLFQFLAISKGVAYTLAYLQVAHVDGVEGDEAHLSQIGLTILSQVFLVDYDVHYLRHDIATGGTLIYFLLYSTLEGHGEVREHRSIHFSSFFDRPPPYGQPCPSVFCHSLYRHSQPKQQYRQWRRQQ